MKTCCDTMKFWRARCVCELCFGELLFCDSVSYASVALYVSGWLAVLMMVKHGIAGKCPKWRNDGMLCNF